MLPLLSKSIIDILPSAWDSEYEPIERIALIKGFSSKPYYWLEICKHKKTPLMMCRAFWDKPEPGSATRAQTGSVQEVADQFLSKLAIKLANDTTFIYRYDTSREIPDLFLTGPHPGKWYKDISVIHEWKAADNMPQDINDPAVKPPEEEPILVQRPVEW